MTGRRKEKNKNCVKLQKDSENEGASPDEPEPVTRNSVVWSDLRDSVDASQRSPRTCQSDMGAKIPVSPQMRRSAPPMHRSAPPMHRSAGRRWGAARNYQLESEWTRTHVTAARTTHLLASLPWQ
jgi:hypothetical protein